LIKKKKKIDLLLGCVVAELSSPPKIGGLAAVTGAAGAPKANPVKELAPGLALLVLEKKLNAVLVAGFGALNPKGAV
jgi:hypothetical protein